jgi:hypothetical protein
MTHHFHSQYIKPFKNPSFAKLALGIFVGLVAATFLNTHLVVDMASLGFKNLVIYLFSWLGIASFGFFPALYALLKKFGRRPFFAGLLLLQAMGAVLLFTLPQPTSPFLTGLTMACFATSFWQMFHLNITGHSSRADVGFQMTLIKIIGQCAGVFGALLISLLHLKNNSHAAATSAFILQALATCWLMATAPQLVRAK